MISRLFTALVGWSFVDDDIIRLQLIVLITILLNFLLGKFLRFFFILCCQEAVQLVLLTFRFSESLLDFQLTDLVRHRGFKIDSFSILMHNDCVAAAHLCVLKVGVRGLRFPKCYVCLRQASQLSLTFGGRPHQPHDSGVMFISHSHARQVDRWKGEIIWRADIPHHGVTLDANLHGMLSLRVGLRLSVWSDGVIGQGAFARL